MAAPRKKQPTKARKPITPADLARAEELKTMDQRIGKAISFIPTAKRGWIQDNWSRYKRVEDLPEPYKTHVLEAEKQVRAAEKKAR